MTANGETTERRSFLLVTMEGSGNNPPQLAVAGELASRGHRVRVLGHENLRRGFERAGCDFSLYERTPVVDFNRARSFEEEVDYVYNRLVFEPSFGHDLLAELEREPADVVLVDRVLYGAMAAAESAGVPAVALFYTLFAAVHRGAEGQVLARQGPEISTLRAEFGLAGVPTPLHQLARTDLAIVSAPRFFDDDLGTLPGDVSYDNVRYVGPLVPEREKPADFAMPWPDSDRRPLIVVSLSTGAQNQAEVLQRLLDAVGRLPARVLTTVGNALDPESLTVPDNAAVLRFVPHDLVLPEASLVVTHAGLGTVMAALRHGVPLLCLPMGRDQHANGRRVQELGIGRTIPQESRVGVLRAAISRVLADRKYARNVEKLGESLDPRKSRRQAADLIEACAARRPEVAAG